MSGNANDNVRVVDVTWEIIFRHYDIYSHDFSKPFPISADMIKVACHKYEKKNKMLPTSGKEPRVLCKQDTREKRPKVFIDRNIFILPVTNGDYILLRGEGYVDIPQITSPAIEYTSALNFHLTTVNKGDSESQYLDHAFAISMVRSFINDPSLLLTVRGRKRAPAFSFKVGDIEIHQEGVQIEVDSGYEGENKLVLIEAKNTSATNTIIRQLYYPYRSWSSHTDKEVLVVFFMHQKEVQKRGQENEYHFWQFKFTEPNIYNSIAPERSVRYRIKTDK